MGDPNFYNEPEKLELISTTFRDQITPKGKAKIFEKAERTNVREHFEENFNAAIWCFPSNFKRWSSAGTRHFSLKT
jgi:hypothetical protein